MLRRAVFLDRDGTLNVEVNYLHRVADLALIPGAAQAIQLLNEAAYLAIVVTNQAGIARGYFDEQAVRVLHEHLTSELASAGARVDGLYLCPHHPDFTGPCACRKPQPGMLRQAAVEHSIDLNQSWLIGDTLSDIAAGHAVGCRTVLVRTGYGAQAEGQLGMNAVQPEVVVDDVLNAVRYILAESHAANS